MTKCEACEIKMGEEFITQPSPENRKRCDDCLHFEERIKKECECGDLIIDRNPVNYYLQHGNFCKDCIAGVNWALINRKHKKPVLINE